MTLALLLAALACVVWPGPEYGLYRLTGRPVRNREPRWLGRGSSSPDPFDVAAGYDLLAVCLRAGLSVPVAARTAASECPQSLARPLRRAADLLELGADPARAWACPDGAVDPEFADLATLGRRAARAGSSLAGGVAELAEATRGRAANRALAQAEKAGVKISGPLGLCFLPAFVCLGIAPVVIGLAGGLLGEL